MNIKKVEKKDGTIVYRTNVYLGVDSLTGKKVQTTATAKTRKACEIKAKQAINKFIKNGSTVAREKVKFDNFEALALHWFDSYKLSVKANSVRATNNSLKVYILPNIGSFKLDKITSVLLQSIVNQWAKNANTAIIKNGKRENGKGKDYRLLLNIIKRIFDYGLQLGALNTNPALQVVPPKLKIRETIKLKYFNNNELKKFLNYLDTLEQIPENQLHNTLYRFLLATGLRIGEALALNWSDISFKNNLVNVNKTIVQTLTVRDKVQNSPKTQKSERLVSIDNETVSLLKEWKKIQSNNTINLADSKVFSYQQHINTYARENVVLKRHFKKACVPNIGFHGFRHTHASLLMNNDVSPKEIQARLGHASIKTTLDVYGHLTEDKKKETAEKFSNILKAL